MFGFVQFCPFQKFISIYHLKFYSWLTFSRKYYLRRYQRGRRNMHFFDSFWDRRIQNQFEHLSWTFLLKLLTAFSKKGPFSQNLHLRYLIGFWIRLCEALGSYVNGKVGPSFSSIKVTLRALFMNGFRLGFFFCCRWVRQKCSVIDVSIPITSAQIKHFWQ